MAINVVVLYNVGFLSDILLSTQAPFVVWFDGTTIVYYYYPFFNYVLHCLLFCVVWWPYISVQYYNGGFLPIIRLNQCYYHHGTRLKCHVEVLSLPPMKQYTLFLLFVWCPCMLINVLIRPIFMGDRRQ